MASVLPAPLDLSLLAGSAAQLLKLALDPDDPGSTVIGWPGQPLRDTPRQGDLMVRRGISGASRIMHVQDPGLELPQALARRGMLTEHRMPGCFVEVADEPGGWAIGRRLLGPDGLVAPETYLLRIAEAGETVFMPAPPRPMIRMGSRGPAVSDAQSLLNRVDTRRAVTGQSRIARCPLVVDGIFGQNTRAATYSFQQVAFPAQPNEWDTIIGSKTWSMLDLHARGDGPDVPIVPPIIPVDPIDPIVPIIPIVFRAPNPPRWGPLLGGLPNAPIRTQNAVRSLIDGPLAYLSMLGDIRRATNDRSFIHLLGWDCYDNFPLDPSASPPCSTSLNQVLRDAVAAGAQVRAMIWRNLTGASKLRAVGEVATRINALRGPRGNGACIVHSRNGGATPVSAANIRDLLTGMTTAMSPLTLLPGIGPHVQRLNTELAGRIDQAAREMLAAHHQKVLIVFDGEQLMAHCGGIDFNPNRAMVATNCIPGSTAQAIEPSDPQHDTHCRIIGPAASDLLKTFVDRWLDHPQHVGIDRAKGALRGDPVSGVPSPPVPNPWAIDAPAGGSTSVIIARTYNPPRGGAIPRQRDIRTLLLRAVANAKSFIYLEDQYLWDFDTPSGGTMAMATALNRALPGLQHITVLIPANAISAPAPFQRAWRARFIAEVRRGHSDEIANRFQVYQLNRGQCDENGCLGRHTYVHSKCWVFDDELAVIGSSNCNRRGYQHDSEVDAFIWDEIAPTFPGGPRPRIPGVPGVPGGGELPEPLLTAFAAREDRAAEQFPLRQTFAQQFRVRLWREHLGVIVTDGADNSNWPKGTAAVGSVVRFMPDRPLIIGPRADPIVFPVIERIAEQVRPIFDPFSP